MPIEIHLVIQESETHPRMSEKQLQRIRDSIKALRDIKLVLLSTERVVEYTAPAFQALPGDFDLTEATSRGLDTSIMSIDLSERPRNILRRAGINTVGDLIQRAPRDLLGLINFNEKCLREVEQKLSELGYSLLPDIDLDQDIRVLHLRNQSQNILMRKAIRTLREITEMTPYDILALDGFGSSAFTDLMTRLSSMGLSLKPMKESDFRTSSRQKVSVARVEKLGYTFL